MDYFDLMQEERMWPTTFEYEEVDTTDLSWTDDDIEDEFEEYA